MSFLYPAFFGALAVLAIPIIIHLFHFRRFRKVYFSDIRFLKEVQQESRSRNRLRHWLILAARLLALSCLVLAFTFPYPDNTGTGTTAGSSAASIYLDNSFSMEAGAEDGNLLEQGNLIVEEIAQAYRETDHLNLITNNPNPGWRTFKNKARFLENLEQISTTGNTRTLNAILRQQEQELKDQAAPNKTAYIISDFQKSITDLENFSADSGINVFLIPIQSQTASNLFIDSAWYESPVVQHGQTATLSVRIRNAGDKDVENQPVTLKINKKQKALANFDVAANDVTEVNLTHTVDEEGWVSGELTVNDYPVTFDNSYIISYYVASSISVTLINGNQSNNFLKSVYQTDQVFRVTEFTLRNIDYNKIGNSNLVVLNGLTSIPSGLTAELKKVLNSTGGNVLLVPAEKGADIESYNSFLTQLGAPSYAGLDTNRYKVERLVVENPFFKNIFEELAGNLSLPQVMQHYPLQGTTRTGGSPLLLLNNGTPLLSMVNTQRGNLFVSAIPYSLSASGFPRHALFVPMHYKMAIYSSRQASQLSYFLGEDGTLTLPATESETETVYTLVKDGTEIIPPQRKVGSNIIITLGTGLNESGFYRVQVKNAPEPLSNAPIIAVNYNRKESYLNNYNIEDIKGKIDAPNIQVLNQPKKNFTMQLSGLQGGNFFWKWFIIAALLFILAETLLIKLK